MRVIHGDEKDALLLLGQRACVQGLRGLWHVGGRETDVLANDERIYAHNLFLGALEQGGRD